MEKNHTFKSNDISFILDNLNTAVFRTSIDDQGTFIDVNPAFLKIFGYQDKTELESSAVTEFYVDPADRDRMREELTSKGYCREWEIQLKRRNGAVFPGRVSSVLVKNASGQALYIDGVVDDITEQKQQVEALRASESKNRTMAEAASEAIIFFSDCTCIEYNSAASNMFGYTNAEFKKLDMQALFTEEYHATLEQQCKGKAGKALRLMAIRKAGQTFPVDGKFRSFEAQGVTTVVCTIADLSAQEDALAQLRDRQLELLEERKVFLNGPVILIQWPINEDAPLTFISENVEAILGYKATDFIEGRIYYPDIVHADDRPGLQEQIRTTLAAGSDRIFMHPYRLRKRDGDYIWVQDYGYVQKDESGAATTLMGYIYDVTEQQESHRKVVENELRYRGLVENSPTGILRIDLAGNILDVNQRMLDILGSPSAEETKKFNMFSFKPIQDAGISHQFQVALQEDKTVKYSGEYRSAWDRMIYFQTVISPIYDAEHEVIGAQANMEDISSTYLAHKAKRAIEINQLEERNIFLSGPIMILKWDIVVEKPLLHVSENVEHILGYSVEEMLDGSVVYADIIHPEDLERVRATAQQALEDGVDSFDTPAYRVLCKDGKYIWVNDHSTIIRDEHGEPKNISGIIYDISPIVETEKELKRTEQTYQELFNAISEAIFIQDPETYEILDVNETMLRMYGYERDEVINSSVQKFSANPDIMSQVPEYFKLAI
ncbi:MAG: PAS domain S-box protein, partial [Candidatus Marinimicrobia bacterium]|nr:PAS domain S-box protein [Candidatus Neomarinimicrobiota bacterium]